MASSMFGRTRMAMAGAVAVTVLTGAAAAETIILNYVVTNNSGSTSTFVITDNMIASVAGPSVISGSVTGTVTDLNGNGATVASVMGGSIYQAIVDLDFGNPVELLMSAPDAFSTFSFSAGQFLSGNGGPDAFVAQVGPQVNSFIGIRLEFTLTAGDSASFTSIFTVEPIPAPGVMGMFAGLVGAGALVRRRRA